MKEYETHNDIKHVCCVSNLYINLQKKSLIDCRNYSDRSLNTRGRKNKQNLYVCNRKRMKRNNIGGQPSDCRMSSVHYSRDRERIQDSWRKYELKKKPSMCRIILLLSLDTISFVLNPRIVCFVNPTADFPVNQGWNPIVV